jgi:hypothetical protein
VRAGWIPLLLACALLPANGAEARDRGADGRFESRSSSHFDLFQDVDIDRSGGVHGSVEFERGVLAVLETGWDGLDHWLGLRPPGRLTVVVYDPQIFDRTFAGLLPFPAAGFYQGIIRVRGEVVVTAALQRTLLHELVHAAWDAAAPSLVLPAWLNEGLAEWFEARASGRPRLTPAEWEGLARLARQGTLPSLASLSGFNLAGFGPNNAGWAYLYSRGLLDHVVRQRGERDLRRVCREIVRTGDVERSFRKVTRATPQKHDAAFRKELAGR